MKSWASRSKHSDRSNWMLTLQVNTQYPRASAYLCHVFAVTVHAAEVRRLWFMNWQLRVPADQVASQIRIENVFLFLFFFVITAFSNLGFQYFCTPYQVFPHFTKTSEKGQVSPFSLLPLLQDLKGFFASQFCFGGTYRAVWDRLRKKLGLNAVRTMQDLCSTRIISSCMWVVRTECPFFINSHYTPWLFRGSNSVVQLKSRGSYLQSCLWAADSHITTFIWGQVC